MTSTDAAGTLDVTSPTSVGDRRVLARRLLTAAIWIAALVAWWTYQRSTGVGAAEAAQRLVDRLDDAWWGVIAYVGVYLLRPLVLFPASILTIAGGLLFGPIGGIVVVVVAANASAMVAFGIGWALGRPPDGEREAASLAGRWTERIRSNGFESVLVMRLLFLPYDAVNYLCGVLRIAPLPFLVATALGSLPGTVSFVLLGASIERVDEGLGGIDGAALAASIAIFVVSLGVARLLRRREAATVAG